MKCQTGKAELSYVRKRSTMTEKFELTGGTTVFFPSVLAFFTDCSFIRCRKWLNHAVFRRCKNDLLFLHFFRFVRLNNEEARKPELKMQKKRQNLRFTCFFQRSGRDSNPRAVARKLTALYLLKYDLIPHMDSGKRTHRYSIRKEDVIAFINDRKTNPLKYIPPDYWYSRGPVKKKPGTIRILPNLPEQKVIRTYYAGTLDKYPNVMDVADVVDFTGYNRRTVGGWIRRGKLKSLHLLSRYVIPKPYLLDFLTSDTYNQIIRKTRLHVKMLWDLTNKKGSQTGPQERSRE